MAFGLKDPAEDEPDDPLEPELELEPLLPPADWDCDI